MVSDWFNAWFTKLHRFAFHRTNGRIGGKLGNIPMALMYTIGARTGQIRMIPLQCYPVEPDGVLVLASNNGQPTLPGWYYNLKAHPEIDALVGRERRRVRAEELPEERHAMEWPKMLRQNSSIDDYKARAGSRALPIFLLRTLKLPTPAQRFQDFIRGLGVSADPSFALAALHDFLISLAPLELSEAVAAAPRDHATPYLENYVAAMVETACAMSRVEIPTWTAQIAPLSEPVFGSALNALRLHLLTNSPPAFRRRSIFIDATLGDRV